LGQAKDFDFSPAIQAFEAWSHVPDEKAAIFSLESKNWGRTLVGMMNSTNHGVGGNLDRIEDTMGLMVREVRPELDILWDEFKQKSEIAEDLLDGVKLSATYMGLCRESFMREIGLNPKGYFRDLFAIYRAGFLPCGWGNGIFPEGEILIY
jgi:hypothetical protein